MNTMDSQTFGAGQKPATAARMYDYYLGGVHNFPADRAAAAKAIAQFPSIPAAARSNRAFLRRAVRFLTDAGIRQFLDIGSGIPTEGNVHEIAQRYAPDARVVYVDIDPVAVAESLEMLEGNQQATALCADLRRPQEVLDHPRVRGLLDLGRPTAILLGAVLHFVPDDAEAYEVVRHLVDALALDSYLLVSHGAFESFAPAGGDLEAGYEIYKRQTTTAARVRTRDVISRFFAGTELVDPGVVWLAEWRPDPDDPDPLASDPRSSGGWAGVGVKRVPVPQPPPAPAA
jgi:hypothetical protein